MSIYFMNTSIIPSNFEGMVTVRKVTIEEVIELINYKFGCWSEIEDMYNCGCYRCTHNLRLLEIKSAIGHESTAKIMSSKLNRNIQMNRLNVEAKSGDIFICFQTVKRMEEGKIYSEEEMKEIPCIWKIMEFHKSLEQGNGIIQ